MVESALARQRQSCVHVRVVLASIALLSACGDDSLAPANDNTPHNEVRSVPCEPDESAASTTPHCAMDKGSSSELPHMPDPIDLHQFVIDLLDDQKPLHDYLQDPVGGEDFTSDELAMCLSPD